MNDSPSRLNINTSEQILESLIVELTDVFDAHGVCATAAQTIASHIYSTTLIALQQPFGHHIDVWICEPDGQVTQSRWYNGHEFMQMVQVAEGPYQLDVSTIPSGPWIDVDIEFMGPTVTAIPLPYPQSPAHFRSLGILCVAASGRKDEKSQLPLLSVAAQLTIFLDRAHLRHRTDQQEVEFGIISDIGSSLTSTLDLEEIIAQVTDAVRRVLGAESLTIGLADPSGKEIVFVEALMGPAFQDMPQVSFNVGQGIAGWVALHGKPAIVNDAYTDRRFSSKVDRDTGFLTRSVLCVPLKIEQRVIGVLEAINKHNGDFDEYDSRLLQAISNPLAIAIENALLHSAALAEKRRIETIFVSMSEGLLTVEHTGIITAANDAVCMMLGRTEDEVLGKVASEIVQTKPSQFSDLFEQLTAGDHLLTQMACDLAQRNGEYVPVLISGAAIDQGSGKIDELIFVFSDLRQVREVERMRDDFFHNIVHELRTPLATILMYARLLREGKAEDDVVKANRFLGVIERESDRLQKLVRQMLQLAKMEAKSEYALDESVDLDVVLEQVLPPLVDKAIEKGLTMTQEIQPDLPTVMGNEDILYMIFKNLVENGVNFTLSGKVSVDAWREGNWVKIEIADEGIGIPEEAIPNLFRRFYRAETAVQRGIAGTGLGLYMVKEGLDSCGGTIEVSSKQNEGTTFVVALPVANSSPSP
jgi:PAS domain S-box-containing protein